MKVLPLLAIALAAQLPEFEVATVKPTNPRVHPDYGPRIFPGGRLVYPNATLKDLIIAAFRVSYWQTSGGEAWCDKDRYDIEAKPADGSGINDLRYSGMYGIEDARLREMLQSLIVERFQLKFHRQTKAGNVYLLGRSSKPLRLRPTEDPSGKKDFNGNLGGNIGWAGSWSVHSATLAQLADFAGKYVLHAPVMDQTGLNGWFDYKEPEPLPEAKATALDNNDAFLRMIGDMGLKLDRTDGPVETFVIDHAEKPSAN